MSNTFGALLNQVRRATVTAIGSTRSTLLERHGQPAYHYDDRVWDLRETEIELPSGKKVTEIRLYKLVDAAIVEVQSQVRENVKFGIQELGDFPTDPNHPHYYKEDPNDSGSNAPAEDHPTA